MKDIKFDFNNMFSTNIGGDHGVSVSEIAAMADEIKTANLHFKSVLSNPKSRLNLAIEWTQLPFQNRAAVKQIKDLGSEINSKYENVLSLGIGGSYLGVKAAQDALAQVYYNEFKDLRKRRPKLYFEGNNLDPETLGVLLKELNPKKTFVIVISKSGETTETKAAFMVVEDWLRKGVGKRFGRQIVAITDPQSGSLRKKVDAEQNKDPLSYRSLPLLKGVGGRFSEFNMGLLHLSIIGVDIQKVLDGAKAMFEKCSNDDVFKNPAYMYAVLHTILYKQKEKPIAILMPFSETLKSTADWYVQLLAESLGKKYARRIEFVDGVSESWSRDTKKVVNCGRTPISCRGTNDLHSIQQNNIEGENNKVVTFIKVDKFRTDIKIPGSGDLLSGKKFSELIGLAQEATEWALVRENRPNCNIIMPEISPYYWGGLLFFFEMATAFEGELLGVNAFDQPGVEGYKNYMYYKLRKPGLSENIVKEIESSQITKDQKFII